MAANKEPSFKQTALWPCAPTAVRGTAINLSCDTAAKSLCYTNRKFVVVRDIDCPENAVVYTGHKSNANVARYAPNGNYIASGDDRGFVQIWAPAHETMLMKYEYQVLGTPVRDIAWDAESKRLVAVGLGGGLTQGSAILVETGSSVGKITNHMKNVNCVALRHARPFRAVTCSDDMTLAFHSCYPLKLMHIVRDEHKTFVLSAAFEPIAGAVLASGALDGKLVFYDGTEGTKMRDIDRAHTGGIYAISWSPDGKRLITSSSDSCVKLWDVETAVPIATWSKDAWGASADSCGGIGSQQLGNLWPRPNLLLAASLDGTISYLDDRSVSVSRRLEGHMWPLSTVTSACNANALVTADSVGRVGVWDVPTGSVRVVENLPLDSAILAEDSFSYRAPSCNTTVVYATSSNKLVQVDVKPDPADPKSLPRGVMSASCDLAALPRSLAFVPASFGAAASNTVSADAAPEKILVGTANGTSLVSMVKSPESATSPAGSCVISSASVREIYASAGPPAKAAVSGQVVALAKASGIVAVGSDSSNMVRLYNAAEFVAEECNTGKEVGKITIGSTGSCPTLMRFTDDGSRLAIARSDGCVRLYDIAKVTENPDVVCDAYALEFSGHSGKVQCVAFSKSMKYAVTGGVDSQLIIWSMERARAREIMPIAHKGGVMAATFDPSSALDDQVFSAGEDACVRRWKINRLP